MGVCVCLFLTCSPYLDVNFPLSCDTCLPRDDASRLWVDFIVCIGKYSQHLPKSRWRRKKKVKLLVSVSAVRCLFIVETPRCYAFVGRINGGIVDVMAREEMSLLSGAVTKCFSMYHRHVPHEEEKAGDRKSAFPFIRYWTALRQSILRRETNRVFYRYLPSSLSS